MYHRPKVSVVIAFLNGENFIGEAINSVEAQTFSDWELILVNDGSTDASTVIAQDAAKKPKVRYLEHPGCVNLGTTVSRNLGAQEARGEYLLYLDHDDILYPHCLERLVAALDTSPTAAAVFATTVFWAWDCSLDLEDYTQVFDPLPNGVTEGPRFLARLIRSEDMHPAVCSTLHRTEVLNRVSRSGGLLSGMYDDTSVLARILCQYDVYLLNEPVSAYRMHRNSMCNQAKAEGTHSDQAFSADRLRFLKWLRRGAPLTFRTRMVLERELLRQEQPFWFVALKHLIGRRTQRRPVS
ncbi:glycosyltransferase family 2 protein [Microvirga terrae]|uniref:Glycosyltransferase family 2 protein n=1 Tax=Microvirga terrae TaxID=2740529 RepID=A0ABY5RMD5_9HYPH|nr:glycosyltransferase family A protein [Microvirga terrae]UVF18393.1 glycosyltransferase family 2 protein [Microvirga terrae]